jgi:hypothetical protein
MLAKVLLFIGFHIQHGISFSFFLSFFFWSLHNFAPQKKFVCMCFLRLYVLAGYINAATPSNIYCCMDVYIYLGMSLQWKITI